MTKLPCEIVQDLLPLYIDKLTSEVTNGEVEAHVINCPACQSVLETMKKDEDGALAPSEAAEEKKKIDILKKYRSRVRVIALSVILAVVALILGVLVTRTYMLGEMSEYGKVTYNIEVVGDKVHVTAIPVDGKAAISDLKFEESGDGFLWIRSRIVKESPLHQGMRTETYTYSSEEPLTMILADEERSIVWEDGVTILDQTWRVWGTKHMYVGDMSANSNTARALDLQEMIGAFTNELETEKEPYGWTIIFSGPLDKKLEKYYRSEMKKSAYQMIALIQNLDHVSFRFSIDGEEYMETYYAKDATELYGRDIKDCWGSVKQFQEFVRWLDTLG
ncbi:MAG: DUF4825 domain-containing protein [Clostridiales bacterium]|nr:DUF4825 domain-containing protein [Clostridiales bacterium]